MRRLTLFALTAVALVGCTDATGVSPGGDALANRSTIATPEGAGLTVMTRNVFEGASFDPILLATDASQIPILAGQIWGEVLATNFDERAGTLAREIARNRPQLVGLQEIGIWRVQTGPDPMAPATDVRFDFLRILLDSLAARGLHYDSVSAQAGVDIQLPAVVSVSPLTVIGVRYTDRVAIIALHDVRTWDAEGGNYQAAVPIQIGPVSFPELRNWASVRAFAGAHIIRFVTTQLEQQRAEPIQVAQADELIGMLAQEQSTVVLAGDFNSAGDGSQTPTYGMLLQAGYRDAWTDVYPHDPGYTCCWADDLRSPTPVLDQRLDLILVHSPYWHAARGIPGRVRITIVGNATAGRTPSGMWPSDHAGVAANLLLPPLGLFGFR